MATATPASVATASAADALAGYLYDPVTVSRPDVAQPVLAAREISLRTSVTLIVRAVARPLAAAVAASIARY